MPQISENDLKKAIAEKKLTSLLLIFGEEKYLIKHYTELALKKLLGEAASDFDYHTFNDGDDISEIAQAVQIVPFMSEYNVVKLVDYDFEALSTDEVKDFLQVLEGIDKSSVLIVTFPTKATDSKKTSKTGKVIEFFAKNGIAAELTAKTSMELERQVMAWVGKRGGQISKNNAAKIIEYAGTELSLLKNEVEKLCAYSNGAEITLPMIDSLVTKNLHAKIFALSDSVLCRNSNQAFSQLNALFYQREDPIAIVNVLGSAFVDVYRVRVAGESGVQNRQLAEDFQYKNRAFVLDKAAKNSRTISTAALREGLTAILNTEAALKSTQCDAKLMVEKLLAQLLLIFK